MDVGGIRESYGDVEADAAGAAFAIAFVARARVAFFVGFFAVSLAAAGFFAADRVARRFFRTGFALPAPASVPAK